MDKVRIDKWLWSVRIFKSRTVASDAVKGSKIKVNGETVRASFLVQKGHIVEVRKDGIQYKYKVLELIEKRVSAVLAAPCYEDLTPKEELDKNKGFFVGGPEFRERGTGRPSKKERRVLDAFKEGNDEDDEETN